MRDAGGEAAGAATPLETEACGRSEQGAAFPGESVISPVGRDERGILGDGRGRGQGGGREAAPKGEPLSETAVEGPQDQGGKAGRTLVTEVKGRALRREGLGSVCLFQGYAGLVAAVKGYGVAAGKGPVVSAAAPVGSPQHERVLHTVSVRASPARDVYAFKGYERAQCSGKVLSEAVHGRKFRKGEHISAASAVIHQAGHSVGAEKSAGEQARTRGIVQFQRMLEKAQIAFELVCVEFLER